MTRSEETSMASATDMTSTTPDVSPKNFRMGMQGLLAAAIYTASFASTHLAAGWPILEATPLAVYLVGLVLVPLAIGYPLALVAGWLRGSGGGESSAAAFLPFLQFAIYGLTGILIWVATREAHLRAFTRIYPAS